MERNVKNILTVGAKIHIPEYRRVCIEEFPSVVRASYSITVIDVHFEMMDFAVIR